MGNVHGPSQLLVHVFSSPTKFQNVGIFTRRRCSSWSHFESNRAFDRLSRLAQGCVERRRTAALIPPTASQSHIQTTVMCIVRRTIQTQTPLMCLARRSPLIPFSNAPMKGGESSVSAFIWVIGGRFGWQGTRGPFKCHLFYIQQRAMLLNGTALMILNEY